MTVSTEVDHNEYTGNGVTTSFPYTFRIFKKSDLVVQVVDLNENITELILDTDYTVTGAGGYTGGNVILYTALANGYQISITRELPLTQETDLRNQGKFFAEVHENAFDKLTMLIQQGTGLARLALRRPTSFSTYYDALNYRISNLKDPVADKDAVNKKWVDDTYTQAIKDAEDAAERAEDAAERAENAVGHGITNLLNVSSVKALLTTAQLTSVSFNVQGYMPGTDFGGGIFYWDPEMPKAQHNGITIFSPTVPWDGSYAGLGAFLAGTGEANAGGSGCWMRAYNGSDILTSWAGHDVTGENAADVPVTAAIKLASILKTACRADAGSTIKCGFTTGVQTHDKFNIFTQASFVLDGIDDVLFYAEKDVNIDTYHDEYKERSVFFLNGCNNIQIKGFKWNWLFTDYSINEGDTQHKQGEWWYGIVAEGCDKLYINHNLVNASQYFVKADNWNATVTNKNIYVNDNFFKYVTNYCFLSRKIDFAEFSRNEVWYNGREWHTFGEAFAPTTYTKNVVAIGNKFYDQIAIQSCITPGSYMDTCLITDNYCRRSRGIFVEIGSASNITISNNQSYSTGERDSSHILLVSGGVDDEPAGGLSNLLITGNVFHGGPYAMREYNVGTPIRRGITFSNNHIVDCPAPIMSNQSLVGMRFTGNYVQVPDDFPNLVWAGQYPVIDNNTLIGVTIRIRDLGYTLLYPTITNNIFRSNSVLTEFAALIDMDNFEGATISNNNTVAASYISFIPKPENVSVVGFKYLDFGLNTHPYGRYGSKCVSKRGDFVKNDSPSLNDKFYGWICLDASTNEWHAIPIS